MSDSWVEDLEPGWETQVQRMERWQERVASVE